MGTNETTKTTQVTKATKVTPQGRPLPSLVSFGSLKSLPQNPGFIPPHGGYERLLSYQKALVVYDATQHFCNRFIDKRSRTYDQMIQAARSGKQNILEGSEASGTSKETEIKLTGVARASQKELLEDYYDFMRGRGIEEWPSNHPYAQRLRRLNRTPGANYQTFKKGIEHPDPAICANVIAGLIKVTCYLLDQQIRRLERDFLQQGGLRERMTRARLTARSAAFQA
jgi:four helix bundle suffix protein